MSDFRKSNEPWAKYWFKADSVEEFKATGILHFSKQDSGRVLVDFEAFEELQAELKAAKALIGEADTLILDDNVLGTGVEITDFLMWKRKVKAKGFTQDNEGRRELKINTQTRSKNV